MQPMARTQQPSFSAAGLIRCARTVAAASLVVVLATMPGCWGKRELEERSFVTLLGIDHSSDGRILVTATMALPKGTRSGAGGPETSTLVLSTAGRNVEEALRQMEFISSRELSTVYTAFVILGEEFARTDIGPIVDVFSRHLHYKPNTLVAVCKGRAYDFLRTFMPRQESQQAEYLLKLVSTVHTGLAGTPLVTMHELKVGFTTLGLDAWAPYFTLASTSPAEMDAKEGQAGEGASGQSGQEEPSESQAEDTIVKLLGSAVFAKVGPVYKMVGSLDQYETMAVLLMSGELEATLLNVAYPGDQAESSLVIHHAQARLDVNPKSDPPEAEFKIVMTGSLSESAPGGDLPETTQEFRQALVRTAQEQMLDLLQKTFARLTSLDTDVIGLGAHAKMAFKTYDEWEAFAWAQRYSRTVASFDVRIHIFTAGFTVEKPIPR